MAKAPVESRIPVFCSGGSAPLSARLSRPLATLSNKVRAHLGGGGGGGASDPLSNPPAPPEPPSTCRRSELALTELTPQHQESWLFRKTALQDDTPTMSGASKHSSFELDESLGILTPDQMAESPLCEEMPSLLLMSDDYQERYQEHYQEHYQEGYQGDGECSRPASPGGKPNPMTDSDFFTESDADMHEELQSALTGDRKAQVIDGRLYQQARCPSFLAAEEMDSSGVYSDSDRTPRPEREEFSPAKLSSMIMEQVNTIKNLVVSVPMEDDVEEVVVAGVGGSGEVLVEGEAMQQETSSAGEDPVHDDRGPKEDGQDNGQELVVVEHQEAVKSPVTQQRTPPPREEDASAPALKKHKMPKRNVVSKIKTMISSSTTSSKEKTTASSAEERRKRVGGGGSRWDAVMSKIAQGQAEAGQRPSLKQVKSRVFAGLSVPPPPPAPQRKAIATSQHQQTQSKAKSRRTRTRGSECSLQTPSTGKSHNSSRNSSISDLSKASPHSVRSKKRESGGRSRSPQSDNSTISATASRRPSTLPTTPPQRNGNGPAPGGEVKTSNVRKSTSKRSLTSVSSKQQSHRDQNRVPGGGKNAESAAAAVVSTSCTELPSPTPHELSSPAQSPAYDVLLPHLQHASAGFEALGVLVNYLVYNLDAFSTPQLKNDLERMKSDWLKTKLELEEAEVSCSRLQDELTQQKQNQEELISQHMHQLASNQNQQQMQIAEIVRNHEETLSEMEKRLQEQAKVLRAQYDAELDHCREQHSVALASAESALASVRARASEQQAAANQREAELKTAANQREAELNARLAAVEAQHLDLKEQSRRFMESMNMDKDTKLQVTANRCKELQDEVESLRTVLELRSSELQELRKQNEIFQVDAELLPPTMQKLMTAQARVEDLEVQLERRTIAEKQLIQENRLLNEAVHQENKLKKRLSQHNEELQWKLKQNSEVVTALVTDLTSKGNQIQAFTPQATGTPKRNPAEMLEFFISRNSMQNPSDQSLSQSPIVVTTSECSPPQSPKVKGVIEKSDSVSWVLDMDDSPEHVVSRLVRRAHSFRGAAPPSPSPHHSRTLPNPHKRQRSRMSQSLSASSSSLKGKKKPARTRSFSADSDGSKWGEDHVELESPAPKSYSPIDRSDDNDDVIVVESVGDDMLSFIDLDAGSSLQNEMMITGELSSSDSETSSRSRRLEANREDLLINRDDGLRERGILPKDAGGEAMISEETSDDDEEEDEESRDSDVEDRSGSLSGDEGSLSGSNSELVEGICERKIKANQFRPHVVSKSMKTLGQPSSDALNLSGMEINWVEEATMPKALQSEG